MPWKRQPDADELGDPSAIRRSALNRLARREYSKGELQQTLGRKLDRSMVAQVLNELERDGQLSDERFVESFVRSRIEKGQGPIRIRQELASRGVDEATIDRFLTFDTGFWVERTQGLRRRRFGEEGPVDRSEWARQARFLAYRGFPSDVIYRVLRAVD